MSMTSAGKLPDLSLGSIEQQIIAAERQAGFITARSVTGEARAVKRGDFPTLHARLDAALAGRVLGEEGWFTDPDEPGATAGAIPYTLDQAKAEIARLKGQLGKANPGASALGEPPPRTLTDARLQIVNLHSHLSIAAPAPGTPASAKPAVSSASPSMPAVVTLAKPPTASDHYQAALAAAVAEPDPRRKGLLFQEARALLKSQSTARRN